MHQRKMKKGAGNKFMSVLMMVLLTFMMFPFTSIVQPPVAAYASEGETVMYPSIGDYITDNIDEQLVEVQENTDQGILGMLRSLFGQADTADMKPASYIYANYTLIDSSMSNGATTLEQVWDETPEAIAGTYPTYSPVYDFGKDTDYLVMFLEQPSMTESAHFLYADFNTLDLDDPISLNDDVIYDHDNGIAYIPKTGLDLFDEENPYEVIELQVQLVYENDFSAKSSAATKIDLSIENNNGKVTAVSPQKQLELSTFDTVSYFQIATEDTASAIDVSDLDVYINGNEQPMDKVMEGDDYNIAYNPANGYMAIAQSPLTITSIKVVINGGDFLSSLSPEKSYAATFNRYLPEHMSWLRDDSGYAKLTNLDWDSLFVGQCFKYTAAKLLHSIRDVDGHPSKKYCYDVAAQGSFSGVVKYFYSERNQNDTTFNFEWIDKAITDGVYQGTTIYPGGTPAAGGDNAGVFDPPNGNGAYWHSIISHPTGVLTDMEGNKQDFTGEWCYDELATLCGHASNGPPSLVTSILR